MACVMVLGTAGPGMARGQTPTLTLEADAVCYAVGDTVTVTVQMGISEAFIVGGQFFIAYDPEKLRFADMVSGEEPFILEIFEGLDEINGWIDYAVGVWPFSDPGSQGPATLATITFEVVADCIPTVWFRRHNPDTTLSDNTGEAVFPVLADMEAVMSGEAVPQIKCPDDITAVADPATGTAVVMWKVTAWDECDGPLETECDPPSGSKFPIGTTSVECGVTNLCSFGATCLFDVEVIRAGCPGDANGDGTVDPLDIGFVLARFGCSVNSGDPDCDTADQNADGFVDPLDAGFILSRFGPCE